MRLAVVGTDTGVGKTVVTAGLTGWLRDVGVDARAVKPVQSGHPPDDDAGYVASACEDEGAAVALRRLEPPLAPRVAAEREGVDLDYEDLHAACVDEMDAADVGLLEGVGGLRVPLAGEREVVDLVAHLDATVVLVARSGLGTLNHTALSVAALERRGVAVHAVVLNEYAGATVAERTNPGELERMIDVPVFTLAPLELEEPADAVDGVREHLPPAVFPGPVRARL